MPVHDAAGTIDDAVGSLCRQGYDRLEIVVVDDGSMDGSAAAAARVADRRVRVLRQEHRGLVAALLHGCEQAAGEYLARLDADDHAHPQRIGAQVEFLETHREVGLLGTWAAISPDDGRVRRFEPPTTDTALRRYLLWDNPFVHSSVMLRRDAYLAAGGYTMGPNEDYRLWIQVARSWQVAVLPEVLVTHRVRQTSLSHGMRRATALRARLRAQWQAARWLGPWHHAIPALLKTCGQYLLAHASDLAHARPVES
jgi:glycosyltransferase involved in cell wall biosynthesis